MTIIIMTSYDDGNKDDYDNEGEYDNKNDNGSGYYGEEYYDYHTHGKVGDNSKTMKTTLMVLIVVVMLVINMLVG